jgi:carboxypeptidase family protein
VPRSMTFGGPSGPASGSGGGAQAMTTTFYPGTADQAGALPIRVAAGAEVSNIVFTLQTAPAFRVSGIVVDENGAPVARAIVMLMNDPRNGMAFLGPGGNTQTGNDGRFSIGDVTAGTYRVNASVPMITSGRVAASGGASGGISNFTSWSVSSSGGETTTVSGGTAPLEVVVADADVTDVQVVVHRPPRPQ